MHAGRAEPGGGERVAQARRVGEVERLDARDADRGQPRQRARQVRGDRDGGGFGGGEPGGGAAPAPAPSTGGNQT